MLRLGDGSWPDAWMPHGVGTLEREPFTAWWLRVGHEFSHLDPRILEQWVFKYWRGSPYFGFPLAHAVYETRRVQTRTIVQRFRPAPRFLGAGPDDPGDVYDMFNLSLYEPYEPAKTMNATGTWNIPIIVAESDQGFRYEDRRYPRRRFWLLEGHQRRRYLRAIDQRGAAADEHEVFVLTVPS